jgi:hypothetical protein
MYYMHVAAYVPEKQVAHGVGAVHVAVQILDLAQNAVLYEQLLLLRGAAEVRDDTGNAVLHLVVCELQQLLRGAKYVAVEQHFTVRVVDG